MRNMTGAGRIPLDRARNDLAKIWLTGAGIVFLLLIIQSILGKYEGQLQEVWSWFVPTMVPTIALMLGVLGASALAEHDEERSVNKAFFGISRSLSFFYLGVLALTLLLQPFSDKPAVQLYTLSNYWLAPIQGIVVAALGVLFTSHEKTKPLSAGEEGLSRSDQAPSGE
jgi:cytochrome bd-type quinol oxidase subunit 2